MKNKTNNKKKENYIFFLVKIHISGGRHFNQNAFHPFEKKNSCVVELDALLFSCEKYCKEITIYLSLLFIIS